MQQRQDYAVAKMRGRGLSVNAEKQYTTPTVAPMPLTRSKWIKFLIAVLLGNALYFGLSSRLPPAAQHRAWTVDLGTVVDFWFCLLVYGLLELGAFLGRGKNGKTGLRK